MSAHILILDDDAAILEMLRLALEEVAGYHVTISQRLFAEVSEVEQLHPDLIVLDVLFGAHRLGRDFLQRLRLYEGTRHLPVILCTTSPILIADQQERLLWQGVRVLEKPFHLEELFALVASLLQGFSRAELERDGPRAS